MNTTSACRFGAAMLIILVLGGCAAPYELSQQERTLAAGMTDDRADEIIHQALTSTASQGGLCAVNNAGQRFGAPRVTHYFGPVAFLVDYPDEIDSVSLDDGAVILNGSDRAQPVRFDFRTLARVTLVSRDTFAQGSACRVSGDGPVFGLATESEVYINVDVTAASTSPLIAALRHYSPQARFTRSLGF